MGADKARLALGSRRLIDIVCERLHVLTDRIVVVTHPEASLAPLAAEVVVDERPHAGPLPALVAGLRAAGARRTLAVACDMPFLEVALLRFLAERVTAGVDAAVPAGPAGPEPLHAAYAASALPGLERALASGERSLRGALQALRVRWVPEEEWRPLDPEGRSMTNVNTPEELARAAELVARGA
jgi:molybdopterin-guanine dinucleotide biosynthesis protein A